ncbi:BACON domain-containing protein [Phocaeicola sp.]
MKINKCILLMLFAVCCVPIYGQTCEDLVLKANSLYKAEKYKDAKNMYQQALKCGDSFYTSHCNKRILLINQLTYKAQKNAGLGVSDEMVRIEYQGGQWPVTVNGGNSWKATVHSDWCSVEIDRRNSRVIITSKPNESLQDRTTEITITSGTLHKIIKVTNERAPEILRSSAQNILFTSEGETNVVDIDSNTNWNILNVPDWLEATKRDGQISFTASANGQNINREAQVKIETLSKSVIIIHIMQGAGKEKLSFSKNDLRFGPEGGDEYIRVNTDAEDWKFGDFPHWCQLTRMDDNTIKVHCTPNEPVNMAREASVNVTTGFQTLGINVAQEPKPIVELIPSSGIGGRALSFGLSAGYLLPMISASSGGSFTGSVVNYAMGNNNEEVSYSSSGGFSVGVYADVRLYRNFYLIAGLNYIHYGYKNEYYSNDVRNIIIPTPDVYLKGKIQDHFTEDYSMNMLDVPILASYRLPVTKTSHVQFNVGPVISFGLLAKMSFSGNSDGEKLTAYKIENHQMTSIVDESVIPKPHHIQSVGEMDLYSKDLTYEEIYVEQNNTVVSKSQSFEASPLKRINYGVRLGVAYELKGICLGVEYNCMLSNMANKRYWEGNRWTVFDQPGSILMSGYKQRNNYLQVKLGYTFRY